MSAEVSLRAADELRRRGARVRRTALPVVQCAVAAGLAWLVATRLVGHSTPFFAPVAAVVSLGVSLGNRLRRSVELVLEVSIGIGVGDLLASVIGSGAWQIMLVVVLAMVAALLLDGGADHHQPGRGLGRARGHAAAAG